MCWHQGTVSGDAGRDLLSPSRADVIVPIFMCTMLGVWLGKKYDIPIITVPLFVVGALAGFTNIFKMVKKLYGQGGESDRNHVKKTK